MAHYATLHDFRFDEDAKDIRGATLYGRDQEKLATIDDVVFDHDTGDIEYLVADLGQSRKVLVPTDHVSHSSYSERDFGSDLTRSDLDRLPAFEDRMLDAKEWKEYERAHRNAFVRDEREAEREYKKEWVDDPVQHERGSTHNITPTDVLPSEQPATTQPQTVRENVTAADLYPQRITDKFTDTAASGADITMAPAGTSVGAENASRGTDLMGPRWSEFQDSVRSNLDRIRSKCNVCSDSSRRVA